MSQSEARPGIVQVTTDPAAPPATTSDATQVLAPTTTAQENLMTAGQRHINAMWERTQQVIALMVSAVVLLVCGYLVLLGGQEMKLLAFTLLSNVFFLVVGTYFQRTNHTKSGGVPQGHPGR